MIIILQKQIFCRVAFFCVLASFILFQSLLAEPLKLENPIEPFQINPILNPFAVVKSHGTKPSKIKIEFTGAKSFSSAELRTALAEPIQEISRLDLTSASADDLAFFLGIFYRKNGFPDADIKWKITEINGLTLTISEGQRVGIGDINFIGNIKISSIVLNDYLVGSTQERFPRLRNHLPFVESDIETGIERIHSLYEAQGFLDILVEPAQFFIHADKADIFITVHEGTPYRFGALNITGDLVFGQLPQTGGKSVDRQTTLITRLEPFSKKPYTPETVSMMQREIVYYYRTQGYYDVEVVAIPGLGKEGIVPVTFQIASGNVYRFGAVKESGLDRLHSGFLKRRFAKLNGKFYNPEKLDDVYRALMRTGLFKSLRFTSQPLPSHEI